MFLKLVYVYRLTCGRYWAPVTTLDGGRASMT